MTSRHRMASRQRVRLDTLAERLYRTSTRFADSRERIPKVISWGEGELERWRDLAGRALAAVGARRGGRPPSSRGKCELPVEGTPLFLDGSRCPAGHVPRCYGEPGRYYVCCECGCVGPERKTARGAVRAWGRGVAEVSLAEMGRLVCRVGRRGIAAREAAMAPASPGPCDCWEAVNDREGLPPCEHERLPAGGGPFDNSGSPGTCRCGAVGPPWKHEKGCAYD